MAVPKNPKLYATVKAEAKKKVQGVPIGVR